MHHDGLKSAMHHDGLAVNPEGLTGQSIRDSVRESEPTGKRNLTARGTDQEA